MLYGRLIPIAKGCLFLILSFLLSGCQVGGQRDVEIVVSKGELRRDGIWSLSPDGDKIAYKSDSHRTVVLFLRTKEKWFIDDDCFDWFDNTILSCGGNLLVTDDADDFKEIMPKFVKFDQIDLPAVLSKAEKIYWQKRYPESIIILYRDYQQNLIEIYVQAADVDEKDVKETLEGYNYKVVSNKFDSGRVHYVSDEKIYSPDGNYYYFRNDSSSTLTVNRVEDDEKIVEFSPESKGQDFYYIVKPGWAWDSSGVYFQIISGGGPYGIGLKHKYHGIRKLKIPEEHF